MTSTPASFDAVLFDLDGVLTATSALHAAAWKQTFDAVLDRWARSTGLPAGPVRRRARLPPLAPDRAGRAVGRQLIEVDVGPAATTYRLVEGHGILLRHFGEQLRLTQVRPELRVEAEPPLERAFAG